MQKLCEKQSNQPGRLCVREENHSGLHEFRADYVTTEDAIATHLSSMSAVERRRLLVRVTQADRVAAASEVQLVRPRLGDWLRNTRLLAGLSQAGFAGAVRLSRPAVASLEAGRQSMSVEFLMFACSVTGADPHEAIRCCLGADPETRADPPRQGRPRRPSAQAPHREEP